MKTFIHNGTTYTMKTLAEASGLSYEQVRYRLAKDMSIEDILKGLAPVHYNPKTSLKQIARENEIDYRTLYSRVQRGMSAEEALQFDPEAAQEAQRKYHTEEEQREARRVAMRCYQARKQKRLQAGRLAREIALAETSARKQVIRGLKADIEARWRQSKEYAEWKQKEVREHAAAYHEERRLTRKALQDLIRECPEGQERELALWMLHEYPADTLSTRAIDDFLGEHSGI